MTRLNIAFDVDDTLIIPSVATGFPMDTPNFDNIQLFRWFQEQGHNMFIWSGGGVDYAEMWRDKLGLEAKVIRKQKTEEMNLCFDDCDVKLANVNVKVARLNNSISRKEWNKHK